MAYDMLDAALVTVKQQGIAIRRDYEIHARMMSMVLPSPLTWHDFDYEAIEGLVIYFFKKKKKKKRRRRKE